MREILNRIAELDSNDKIIVHCKSGQRSAKICKILIENNFRNVKNLKGGILAWSKEIDSSKYVLNSSGLASTNLDIIPCSIIA